jgi:type I restriction-modification system DNA methylase subunit
LKKKKGIQKEVDIMAILNLKEIQNKINDLFEALNEVIEKTKFSNEEKLKIEVLTVLSNFFKEHEIDFSGFIDYEVSKIGTLKINGRVDALYGSLVIEFKQYNYLSKETNLKEALKKVKEDYLNRLPKIVRKNFVAIIFDGKQIVFINYDPDKDTWTHTIRKFDVYALYDWLVLLSGLFKKTITAQSLKNDFSIEAPIARDFITILYKRLNENLKTNQRIKMLFDEWDKTFRYIYGGVLNEDKIIYDFKEISEKILKTKGELYADRFLFVIYTYYAFIIKLIASEIICISLKLPFDSPSRYLMKESNLRESLKIIEEGKFFKEFLGIENYIEGGFFSWYLDCWDEEIKENIEKILAKINEYNPQSLIDHNHNSRDLLRNLYQEIVPKRIRHDLGEYYTPHWLAQLAIEEAGYDGSLKYKVLDPGCGSGTFLVEFINNIKKRNLEKIDKSQLLEYILINVVGFDVNPVAVLTARTNYLLAISDLIVDRKNEFITLPVYLADSILTPTTEGKGKLKENVYNVSTVEGIFKIPKEVVDKNQLSEILSIVEECIENEYPPNDFIKLLDKSIELSKKDRKIILTFYKSIYNLHKNNKNKVWVKIIQNSFAPLLFSDFDFVIGNPPWIKWEFLSEDYKRKLAVLYLKIYKLYSYKGMLAGMGFAHDDISIVFTYVCMDKYLKIGGRLAFVLKQTLYKSIAGKEFRKFCIEKKETTVPVKVIKVHDLLILKPFKYSGSETSIAVLEKGKETSYPVPYLIWNLKKGEKVDDFLTLEEVKNITVIKEYDAYPDPSSGDSTDVWILVKKGQKPSKAKQTHNPYEVRHGVVNDLNSVFFIKILGKTSNNLLSIKNMQIGKTKVKNVETKIETDLVYPVIKPRHVKKWQIKGYYYVIIPHKKHGLNNESELRVNYPKTYNYLFSFRKDLLKRASRWFKGSDKPFYSLFGIGDYTFKPFKVVWSSIGYLPAFAVATKIKDQYIGEKVIIPDNTIGYISFDSIDEAHYVCGILNSNIVRKLFSRRSTKSKWGISISMVKNLPIPKYDSNNKIHREISSLSRKAHDLVNKVNDISKIEKIEKKIDILVEKIIKP